MKYILTLTIAIISFTCMAQVSVATHHGLHSPYNLGEYYKHEIGAAVFPYKLANADKITIGFHGHYLYNMVGGRIGVGVGYENILDDFSRQSLMGMFAYRPFAHITVILSPGATLFKINGESDISFSGHTEVIYEWAWRNVHFGPTVEYTYHKDYPHYSAGLHVGLGF